MIEWEKVSLGEVAKVQTGPFGSQLKNEQYIIGGTPVVTVEHINDFKIKDFDYPSVTSEDRDRLSKYLLKEGDIVFTRVGSVDLSAYVGKNQDGWMFSSRMLSVRPIKKVDSKFLSYFFRQPSFRSYIFKISVGATMPSINTSILKSIPISYPPLQEQKAIANVLTAFDDKIELLQQQNQTLETIAQTIFKEWFGKYQLGDELPEGWRVGKLGGELETSLGGTPSKSNSDYWVNGNIPWINSGAVNKFRIIEGTTLITKEGLKKSATKLLPKGTIVLAITGATLGQYSRLEIDCCFNQSVVGITGNEKIHSSYIYFWIAENIHIIIRSASGGAHQHINKENVNSTDFIIPTKELLEKFYKIVDPIMDKISENMFQIQSLTKTRDTLLPKLMSGKVRVKMNNHKIREDRFVGKNGEGWTITQPLKSDN